MSFSIDPCFTFPTEIPWNILKKYTWICINYIALLNFAVHCQVTKIFQQTRAFYLSAFFFSLAEQQNNEKISHIKGTIENQQTCILQFPQEVVQTRHTYVHFNILLCTLHTRVYLSTVKTVSRAIEKKAESIHGNLILLCTYTIHTNKTWLYFAYFCKAKTSIWLKRENWKSHLPPLRPKLHFCRCLVMVMESESNSAKGKV